MSTRPRTPEEFPRMAPRADRRRLRRARAAFVREHGVTPEEAARQVREVYEALAPMVASALDALVEFGQRAGRAFVAFADAFVQPVPPTQDDVALAGPGER